MGGRVDIQQFLTRKYDIMEKEANARLMGARRALVPEGSGMPSIPGLGPVGMGGGPDIDQNDDLKRQFLEAQIADVQDTTRARKIGLGLQRRELATKEGIAEEAARIGEWGDYLTRGMTDEEAAAADKVNQGYKKGVAVVRKKGQGMKAALMASGKKDTVKAKLAPGEAVLNKSAADMLGRGMIAKLNAKGAAKMGLV